VNRRLYRSTTERVLGGVAGGVADYFDLDPALVRVAWAILILASGGIFLLLYLVMWFVVPEAPAGFSYGQPWPSTPSTGDAPMPPGGETPEGTDPAGTGSVSAPGSPPTSIAHEWAGRRAERRRHRSGGGGIVIGSLLILIGAWFLVRDYVPWLNRVELWPIALLLLGVVLLVSAMGRRSE
jgi:phage shock protein C